MLLPSRQRPPLRTRSANEARRGAIGVEVASGAIGNGVERGKWVGVKHDPPEAVVGPIAHHFPQARIVSAKHSLGVTFATELVEKCGNGAPGRVVGGLRKDR